MDLGNHTTTLEATALQQLPPELVSMIAKTLIDMATADAAKHTLRQDEGRTTPPSRHDIHSSKAWRCSLAVVCQAWRHACAKALFTRIVTRLRLIDQLIDLLRSPINHIPPMRNF